LRQKIESDAAAPRLIHSIRGFGYSFEPRGASTPEAIVHEEAKLQAAG
jgi:hypothetical protein